MDTYTRTETETQIQASPGMLETSGFEEFLYMDPDTGMIVCMIADGDGFRPATATQELEGLPVHWSGDTWVPDSFAQQKSVDGRSVDGYALKEEDSLDDFVKVFEHAYLSPSAG